LAQSFGQRSTSEVTRSGERRFTGPAKKPITELERTMQHLREVMITPVATIGLDETLERIRAIFLAKRFHHLVVVHRGRVVGVISDRDLLKNISPFIGKPMMERSQDLNTLQKRAHQIMTRALIVAFEETPIEEAAAIMVSERISCLPIVDERMRLRGIVTRDDLLRYCSYCLPPKREAA
jgi:acetoin utilization protein AcuB